MSDQPTATSKSRRPPVAKITTPRFPRREGIAAEGTALLIFVSIMCIFQYWLLTATLEAYHAGDRSLPFGAFLASLGCFIFAAGLTFAGEAALLKQQDYFRKMKKGRAYNSSLQSEKTSPPPSVPGPTPASHFHKTGDAAGGGDAG